MECTGTLCVEEFEQERNHTNTFTRRTVRELMGDRPINLNSPEQLSWVIYSRKPHDKKVWKELFDDRMPDAEYKRQCNMRTVVSYSNRKLVNAVHVMALAKQNKRRMVHHMLNQIDALVVTLQDIFY